MSNITANLRLNITNFKDRLSQAQSRINKFSGVMRNIFAAGGIFAGVSAITNLARGALDLGSSLSSTSKNIGITAEQLQVLTEVARMNGFEFTKIRTVVAKVGVKVKEAASGNKLAAETFKYLGLNIKKMEGMNAADQFHALATAVSKSKDRLEAMRRLTKIFSEENVFVMMETIDTLATKTMPEWTKSLKESGRVMSNETVAGLRQASDAWADFGQRVKVTTGRILAAYLKFRDEMSKKRTFAGMEFPDAPGKKSEPNDTRSNLQKSRDKAKEIKEVRALKQVEIKEEAKRRSEKIIEEEKRVDRLRKRFGESSTPLPTPGIVKGGGRLPRNIDPRISTGFKPAQTNIGQIQDQNALLKQIAENTKNPTISR